jgi:hypothetical protein
MYRKILFLFIGIMITAFIFISCSDDSSTSPAPTPKCTIVSPNGGEVLQMGTNVWVHFDNELTEAVGIHVYKGQDSIDVVDPMIVTSDSVQWVIPTTYTEGFDYKLKIVSTEDPTKYDFSDANFTIAPAGNYIMVSSPNGGDIWLKGQTKTINWITNITGGTVRIDLYKNNSPEAVIYNSQANDGTQGWTVPGTLDDSADYSIQIQSIETPAVLDTSDSFFCIASNVDTENVVGDWELDFTWLKGTAIINFESNQTWNTPGFTGTWIMTGNGIRFNFDTMTTYYIGIVDGNHIVGTMVSDGSVGTWSAERVIPELLTPNGGQVWMRGTTQTITWDSAIVGNGVLSLTDSTGVVQNIATVLGSTGTYEWAIPTSIVPNADYKIRIAKEINPNAKDESDSYICISADVSVDITGEWQVNYFWSKSTMYLNFKTDNTWEIVGNTTYTGIWALTGNGLMIDPDYSNFIYIGIVGTDVMKGTTYQPPSYTGVWDAQRLLEVTAPNGGEFFQTGNIATITWTTNITAEFVKIDLYENDVFSRTLFANNVNNYSKNWTIPADLVTSTKYKIRITSTTSDIYDESDAYFTISGVPATTVIEDETFDDGVADHWTAVEGTWAVADSLYTAASNTLIVTSAELDSVTGNFVIETKMKKVAGDNNFYGININGDTSSLSASGYWNNAQMLLINPNGQYGFWTCVGGSWTTNIGWTANATVNAGLDTWNVLKIIVNNTSGEYHLFINGQYINTAVSSALSGGKIGLVMYDGGLTGELAVDYVKISRINKSALEGIKLNKITGSTSGSPTTR